MVSKTINGLRFGVEIVERTRTHQSSYNCSGDVRGGRRDLLNKRERWGVTVQTAKRYRDRFQGPDYFPVRNDSARPTT